jgi:RNA polymerase sigma-70 factor (ECF subfamily)
VEARVRELDTSTAAAYAVDAPDLPQDEVLAKQAQHDAEAFGVLYQRHVKSIYRYHLARTGNVQDAQDLTAQTFLAALEGIAAYRGQRTFAGWLFGIASHKAVDHFRRVRAHRPLAEVEGMAQDGPPVEEAAVTRLEMARVREALETIAPERAEALILRIFSGLSAAQTGQVMGKSEAAVRMLVHRGLCDLRQTLSLQWGVEQ